MTVQELKVAESELLHAMGVHVHQADLDPNDSYGDPVCVFCNEPIKQGADYVLTETHDGGSSVTCDWCWDDMDSPLTF